MIPESNKLSRHLHYFLSLQWFAAFGYLLSATAQGGLTAYHQQLQTNIYPPRAILGITFSG